MNLPVALGNPPQPVGAVQPQGGTPWGGPGPGAPGALVTITAEQKLELLEYWRSITKRKWAILALGLVVAGLAAVVSFAITPVYKTSATVLIEAGKGKILAVEEVYSMAQQREHYQTQIEILKSREVAERTVRALKLWNRQDFDPRKDEASWHEKALAAVGIQKSTEAKTWTDDDLVAVAARRLMQNLSVAPVRGSQLVQVSFESTDPELAAEVANAVSQQYIAAEREERYAMTQQVSQQLQERLAELRDKLTKSEQALQAYREKRGIVALGGSAQAVAGQTINDALKSLTEAQTRRAMLEGEYQQARAAGADFGSIPSVARNPAVGAAQAAVTAGQAKLSELLQTLGPAHFKVQQAEAELAEQRATLRKLQTAAVSVLMREYEAARNTEQSLANSVSAARNAVQDVNRQEFELTVLEREYQSNRQLFDMFTNRAKETNLTGTLQPSAARVVDKAVPSLQPIKPNKRQIVLVALLLSLLVGALASVLLDRLDNTIKGSDDAELRLKQPVLAALPVMPDHERPKMARVFMTDAHSHFAEGIRTARTGVMLSNLDAERQTLLITSTLPGEGKTTVSINLALAHAQSKRTLLIDADMRRSQVSRALGLARHAKGLTNLMAGTAAVERCVQPVEDSTLMVMGVGDLPPNPLELLLSNRFKEVLAELGEHYEMIIIDSPPVELVSEALVLAPLVTSVTLVVKAMSTPAPLVRKSLMRLQRTGGRILGVIVNQLDFAHSQKYYGEYGSVSYGYGSYGYAPQLEDSKFGAEGVGPNAVATNDSKARKRA
jgi:polysaccharide biosynthesis transport protein